MREPDNAAKPEDLDAMVSVSQIIAGALFAGVLTFLGIVVFLRRGKGLFAPEPWSLSPSAGIIALLGLVFAGMVATLSFVIPKMFVRNARAQLSSTPTGQAPPGGMSLAAIFQSQLILRMALLEGAAFFNTIAFLLEGRIPSLLAVLVLMGLLISSFPTRSGMVAWMEDQRALMLEERQSLP